MSRRHRIPVPVMKVLAPVGAALLFGAGAAGNSSAQPYDAVPVGVGAEVRIGVAAEPNLSPYPRRVAWQRGMIHGIHPDTLYLRRAQELEVVPIPRLMITDIQESLGVNRWVSAREVGLGVGGFGLLVMMLLQETNEEGEPRRFRSSTLAYSAAGGGGFALGFAIGAIRPYERWREGWLRE